MEIWSKGFKIDNKSLMRASKVVKITGISLWMYNEIEMPYENTIATVVSSNLGVRIAFQFFTVAGESADQGASECG